MKHQGYTLLELLVSVAITAILAGLLMPVVIGAKRKAKETSTINNLKQIGTAVQMYRESYDDQLPERLSFLFPSYVSDAAVFRSPLDPKEGHYPFTGRMEGDTWIKTGVSFTWVPEWSNAIEWGWWNPWPKRGQGKWLGLTPISECHWFWATKFNEFDNDDQRGNAKGRAVILTLDGSLIYQPAKIPMEQFDPR
jgi:prepilin-type N-terminal cleavage/methylation domain-containing protein